MDCERIRQLHAYHDGELDALARTAMAAHVASCAECAAELDRMRRMARFVKAATIPSMGGNVLGRMRERLRAELENGRRTARLAGWLTAVAAAVMVCCSAALSTLQVQPATAQRTANVNLKGNGDSLDSMASMMVLSTSGKPEADVTTSGTGESEDPLTKAVAPMDLGSDGRE